MKKRLIVAGLVAGAFGLTAPAFADQRVDVPGVGYIEQTGDHTGGSLEAEGTGPGPLSGFVYAEGSAGPPPDGSACADDNGTKDQSDSPTCTPSAP